MINAKCLFNQNIKSWDKAIELAKKQNHEKDYGYITSIFKKLEKITEGKSEEWYNNLKYSTAYIRGLANVHNVNQPNEMPDIIKNKQIDRKLVWNMMKYLTAPIDILPAFKKGYIDEKGRPTGKSVDATDKKIYNHYIKLLLALRVSLEKLVPKVRLNLALQKLFLLRENGVINPQIELINLIEETSSGDIAIGDGKQSKENLARIMKIIKEWEKNLLNINKIKE